jgi:catechol 2,3-dioxygenase-like lactoylglutathione lyase family enzyme
VSARLTSAVPIIPARQVEAATAWYRDELGFEVVHAETEYGVVARDDIQVHFWGPSGIDPKDSMTMYRIGTSDLDALYEHCRERDILHPNAPLERKPWGLREFAVVDGDGNLITFFAR